MKKKLWLAAAVIAAAGILAAAFFLPDTKKPSTDEHPGQTDAESVFIPDEENQAEQTVKRENIAEEATAETIEPESQTSEVPAEAEPEEPTEEPPAQEIQTEEPPEAADEELHCTLHISCSTILQNTAFCSSDVLELVPADGEILPPTDAVFYEGESVFNVLQRVCKERKLHMEFSNTALYQSVYLEGIGNIYEFDAGECSGWMYNVNDWFPNYSCSQYTLQNGDTIHVLFTCNLGADIGGADANDNNTRSEES